MSQEKVDKYKQQKKERKNPKKVSKIKKIIPYAISTVIALVIVAFFVISIGKQCGIITTPTEPKSWSDEEIASLRQLAIQNTDPNVQYTTAKQLTTKKAKTTKAAVVTTKVSKETTKKSAKK